MSQSLPGRPAQRAGVVRADLHYLSVADLFPPERFGGSERVIGELSTALARRGKRVGIIAGGLQAREPDLRDQVKVWRIPVRIAPLPALFLTSYMRFRRMPFLPLGEGGALLLHHPLSSWGLLRAGHGRRFRRIAFFYGPIDEEWAWHWRGVRRIGSRRVVSPLVVGVMPRLLRRIQQHVLRQADRIVVLGSYTEALARGLVLEGQPIHVVPPGVDLERFHPPTSKAREKQDLGFPPDAPVVLSVRRLVPRMGLSTLLEAAWLLRRSQPRLRVVIVGTGEMAPRLMREAAAMGIADSLVLAGQVTDDELVTYYRAADVFVLPSTALEGFGLVTLEALASGVPVVGTAVGETPWIIGGKPPLGRVVPPGDAQALALACEEVILQGPTAGACREFAARYSWDEMARRLEDILGGVVS